MKIITLLTVAIVLLLELSGAIPKSSVGGPLTEMFILVLATWVAGCYEAWVNRRGVLGWIVSVVVSVVGGFLAMDFGGAIMEAVISRFQPEGSLASSHHPLLYVSLAGMAVITLLGSWLALQVVDRLRLFSAGTLPSN